MISDKKTTVFIESNPLLDENPSGVAKLLFSIIEGLAVDANFSQKYQIALIVPLGKRQNLHKWNLPQNIIYRTLPLPLRVINHLDKYHLMPPIDLYLGRGIYIFPNYRRLPLLNSSSLTYVHDAAYKIHPNTVLNINRLFLERVVPNAVKMSNKVITLSQQSRQELQDIFPNEKNKIEVVSCGIDQLRYRLQVDDDIAKTTLSDIGVKQGQYILFVGNIEPRKNINYLIDVYVNLVDKNMISKKTKLLLVGGGGWNNESLLKKIDDLNSGNYSIIIPKRRIRDDELPILYSRSLTTALLSVHEGFGLTPLEALAAGSGVVVSDIPVLREVCGEAVAYAPLDDISRASEVFERAIDQKISPLIVQSQLDKYSWSSTARQLTKILDKITLDKVSRG